MPDKDNNPTPALRLALTAVFALLGMLLLVGISAIYLREGNPTLATAAGMAAIGLIGWAVRRLVKAAVPGDRDDDDLPPTADRPISLEVE
jgi:hypothetical protein